MKKDIIKESSPLTNYMYFHGTARENFKLEKPSYEHPFYITADVHYAMAFATKMHSSTDSIELSNDRDYEVEFRETADNNYVYIVSLKPDAKLIDFRNPESKEYNEILNLFSETPVLRAMFKFCSRRNDHMSKMGLDIYTVFEDFTWMIQRIQFDLSVFDDPYRKHPENSLNFLHTLKQYDTDKNFKKDVNTAYGVAKKMFATTDEKTKNLPKILLTLFDTELCKIFDYEDFRDNIFDDMVLELKNMNEKYFKGKKKRYGSSLHWEMSFFFERLHEKYGYQGIITTEEDNNEDTGEHVYTEHAVGIWDKDAISMVSSKPLLYADLKENISPPDHSGDTIDDQSREAKYDRDLIEKYMKKFSSSYRTTINYKIAGLLAKYNDDKQKN